MKKSILFCIMIIGMIIIAISSKAQVTTLGNSGGASDYAGWNSSQNFDFNLKHRGSHNMNFFTSDAQRMTILSGGNVGIGLTAPANKLQVHSTTESYLQITNDHAGSADNHGFKIGILPDANSYDDVILKQCQYASIVFKTNSTPWTADNERMRILYNGLIGIGTPNPQALLHIAGGDLMVGEINPVCSTFTAGIGRKVFFEGGSAGPTYNSENSDPMWMARYNLASDLSELRVNVSDNAQYSNDGLNIGSLSGSTWYSDMFVKNEGKVYIHKLDGANYPQNNLDINGNAVIGNSYAGAESAPSNGMLVQGKVGIGSGFATGTPPVSQLDIEGNLSVGSSYSGSTAAPTNGMIVEGNVGIGVSSSLDGKLDVRQSSLKKTINVLNTNSTSDGIY